MNSDKKSIKVLHLINRLVRGGLETWLMEMARNANPDEIKFDVCQIDPQCRIGEYEEEFTELGGKIYGCPLRKNLFSFNRDFRKILIEGNYDILHSHHYYATGYFFKVAQKVSNLKFVAHMHPTVDFKTGQRVAFPRPLYRKVMKKWIYRYSDAILGASEATLDLNWGVRWCNDKKIHFQPNGIDISKFDRDINPSELRKKLNLPLNSKIVLTVGRHVPHKKHIIIPDIAKEVCKVKPDIYFVINGSGPLKNELEEKIKSLKLEDRFRLISGMPDIIPLWKSSDVFLFPSTQEGFGIVVIEAAAASLAVIAREIPGVSEAIRACKNKFMLNMNSSVEEWISATIKALDVGREQINDYVVFEKNFLYTTKKSLSKLMSIYQEVLE